MAGSDPLGLPGASPLGRTPPACLRSHSGLFKTNFTRRLLFLGLLPRGSLHSQIFLLNVTEALFCFCSQGINCSPELPAGTWFGPEPEPADAVGRSWAQARGQLSQDTLCPSDAIELLFALTEAPKCPDKGPGSPAWISCTL